VPRVGPALFAALLLALTGRAAFASETTQPFVAGRAEAGAGIAPRFPGEKSVPSLAFELAPSVGIRDTGERSNYSLSAGPRIYYRLPAYSDLGRPLLLVRAAGTHQLFLTRRWTWETTADLSYGEVDYTASALALNARIAASLTKPILSVFNATADTGLRYQLSARNELTFGVFATEWQPLGNRPDLTPTTAVGIRARENFLADFRRKLGVPFSARYYTIANRPDITVLSLGLDYRELLERRTTLELYAGGAFSVTAGHTSTLPELTASIERVLHERLNARIVNRVMFFTRSAFDPTTALVYSLGGGDISLRTDLYQNWGLTLDVVASTVISKRPLFPGSADTSLSGSLVVDHPLAHWLTLSFGSRALSRGSHLNADQFHLIDRQIWGFVALNALIGLTPGQQGFGNAAP
jgi:hypothetical protein